MNYKREQTKDEVVSYLRRLRTHEIVNHMKEILNEGMWDVYDPCDYENEEVYVKLLMEDSAKTLINSYIIEHLGNYEDELVEHTIRVLGPKFIKSIRRLYTQNREDCE